MTIANNEQHKAAFVAQAQALTRRITDLQREIDIALQIKLYFAAMQMLIESDVHLQLAKDEITAAIARINAINGGLKQ